MNFAVFYLLERFLFRFTDFFHHWYVDFSRGFVHTFLNFLERLDRVFAVHITARYFFRPLYQDYSLMGRVLGIIFRSGRIILGTVIYALVSLIFFVVYLIWIAIPLLLLFGGVLSLYA